MGQRIMDTKTLSNKRNSWVQNDKEGRKKHKEERRKQSGEREKGKEAHYRAPANEHRIHVRVIALFCSHQGNN